jgi:hypothetical protein
MIFAVMQRGEKMDDLISRQAAIDAVRMVIGDNRSISVCDAIKQLPPIQPAEPKKRGMNIEQEKMIVESLPSLYPMQKFEEDAIEVVLDALPSAEPDIIYCKDCRKHNKRIGDYVEKSDGTYDWIWKDQACPLAEFRGVAQGHEFDYQFCAYGERRTE